MKKNQDKPSEFEDVQHYALAMTATAKHDLDCDLVISIVTRGGYLALSVDGGSFEEARDALASAYNSIKPEMMDQTPKIIDEAQDGQPKESDNGIL